MIVSWSTPRSPKTSERDRKVWMESMAHRASRARRNAEKYAPFIHERGVIDTCWPPSSRSSEPSAMKPA